MSAVLIDRLAGIAVAVVLLSGTAGCREQMPSPSSDAYSDAVAAFYTGIAAIEVGEDRRAEELLLQVTELARDEPAAWANLGLLALRRNELDLARERLDRARELAPEESRIHFLLGLVEATRGNAEEAIAYFERARELDPQNVRAIYALAEQVETYRGEGASEQVRSLIDAILEIRPNNLAVIVERARLAALEGDEAALAETIDRLEASSRDWSTEAQEQLTAVRQALESGRMDAVATELTFFSNVLKREPAYRESIAAVRTQTGQPTELIGSFLALQPPPHRPAPPDESLSFDPSTPAGYDDAEEPWRWARAVALSPDAAPIIAAALQDELVLQDGTVLRTPGELAAAGLIATDYNYDFRIDLALAGPDGFRLYRGDGESSFVEVTDEIDLSSGIRNGRYAAGWTADVDMDGDLDLILAPSEGPPVVLRNNGDGTFSAMDRFGAVADARGFVWTDMDGDGDPDAAFLDAGGRIHYFQNNRSQGFAHRTLDLTARAITAADLDADGIFELVALRADGSVVRYQQAAGVDPEFTALAAAWDAAVQEGARLFAADVDNNGGLDLVASSGGRSGVFLSREDSTFAQLGPDMESDVYTLAEVTGDGRLDMIGVDSEMQPVRLENRGTRDYRSTIMRPIAAEATGDQRINPFGLGGEVEVRSGLLYQKQPIADPIIHFGLGERDMVHVARIVWPNGDIQAEFDLLADQTVETQQRLKGSCPWLFAYDGEGMAFVTDFIWRSPLGLRINAQETAGIMTTEDWVKVEGSELQPRDDVYDLRITAELWETHFFDHVSLMVVDHPVGTEIFVDERFAFPPPELEVLVTREPTPVSRVVDDAGRDVTSFVADDDDRYLASFERGQYQGVAKPHSIEIDLRDAPADGPLRLLASGWVRPTDSSINVALAQGGHSPPTGVRLDVPDGRGGWKTVYPNLGFPAGKYKTMVVDLTDIFPADPIVRLTTNLEIYWDAISWAPGMAQEEIRTTRLAPSMADLRYRGYSLVVEPDRTHPEVPIYDSLASSVQVWQDLEGYYTRFGEVGELLKEVDDRYVIMNAGDEMRLEFPAMDAPAPGWTRSFVLVGDGWVKDGDYNTTYSETVLPLPAHDLPGYDRPRGALEDDPVYQRHPEDWRTYHTRYVANEAL